MSDRSSTNGAREDVGGTVVARSARELVLRDIVQLDWAAQLRILEVRNQENVRKFMYTSHFISEDEHATWIKRLRQTQFTKVFAVYWREQIIGVASLNQISAANRRADWAFYLDEKFQGRGLGSALEFRFLDQVFFETEIEKLNCEVMENNRTVIMLHKRFGFVEEGIRREHIIRDNIKLNSVLLGITKREWLSHRPRFLASDQDD